MCAWEVTCFFVQKDDIDGKQLKRKAEKIHNKQLKSLQVGAAKCDKITNMFVATKTFNRNNGAFDRCSSLWWAGCCRSQTDNDSLGEIVEIKRLFTKVTFLPNVNNSMNNTLSVLFYI